MTKLEGSHADLRETNAYLENLINYANAPIIVWDPQFKITRFNHAFESLTGRSEAEVLGKPLEILFPSALTEDSMNQIRKTLTGERWETVEIKILNLDGTVRTVLWNSATLFAPDGITPKATIAQGQDITKRKQAEEERRKLEERMSQVQKLEALGTLVGGVAHNLNNVLMAIMGAASLREGHATDTKDLEAYTLIGKACKRGRDVVKSLIHFAQPTLAAQVPCDVHALITEVRVLLESTVQNRIQILEANLREPLWIIGDAGSLNHALMNLCLNSLDAMPNGGTLTFRTSIPEKGWVELSVEDNGEGMAPEVLARVMEPFFTTKEVGKGTGLGLSMTHGVIKAHGGTLEISSVVGEGTTVKLRLPRIPAPAQQETIATPTPSLGSLNVLLVDDDEDVRFLVARMLKNAGHQLKTVAGGEDPGSEHAQDERDPDHGKDPRPALGCADPDFFRAAGY